MQVQCKQSRSTTLPGSPKNNTFFKPIVQARLLHPPSGDAYEQEAINMAEFIKYSSSNNNFFFRGSDNAVQRKCGCEAGEKPVIKSAQNSDALPSLMREVLDSDGQGIDHGTKTFMELGFGYDFSEVRVHSDTKANQSSSQINALAYTHGNHVVFGPGQYRPHTDAGKQLLAHELTHVIQQGGPALMSSNSIQRQPAEKNPFLTMIDSVGEAVGDVVTAVGDTAGSVVKSAVCAISSQTPQPMTNPMSDISTFQSPGVSGWFGAKFGCFRNNCSRRHQGWDIHAAPGTPVIAVVSGRATRHNDAGGFGIFMDLRSDADHNIVYRYAHLSATEANGNYCTGDKIGESGTTGNAAANRPHLHIQVINNGTPVDPGGFFTEPTMVIEQVGTVPAVINKTLPEPCAPC